MQNGQTLKFMTCLNFVFNNSTVWANKKNSNRLPDDKDAKWILAHVKLIQIYNGIFERHLS